MSSGWSPDETGLEPDDDDADFWCPVIDGPCHAWFEGGWDCPAYGCARKAGINVDDDDM